MRQFTGDPYRDIIPDAGSTKNGTFYAVVLSKIIFSGAICILNAKALRDRIGYVQEKKKTFLIPTLASLIMGVIAICDSSDLRIIRRSVYRNNHCTSGSSCSIWSIYRCTWRDYGRRITWHAKRSSLVTICRRLHLIRGEYK